jgi:hypothetical protein
VNTDVRGRSYAPRGQTPVTMAVGGTREKLSMISTVTNQGRANWMIIDGAFNHERLIEFMQALVRDGKRRRKKVFLILGNLGVHHCKHVKAWLAENKKDIEVSSRSSTCPVTAPSSIPTSGSTPTSSRLSAPRYRSARKPGCALLPTSIGNSSPAIETGSAATSRTLSSSTQPEDFMVPDQ